MMKRYESTIRACFTGYIIQALINNFAPLLFLTFQSAYQIPLSKITMLVTFNFGLQLLIDLASALFLDKIGYRVAIVSAQIFAGLGLISMTVLPELLPDPFVGLLISVTIYALGGGLLEVLVSPIVEACPTEHKEKTMSMLHSFYCWGHVGVVLVSTLFFQVFGIQNWKVLALIWAVIPIINTFVFMKVPIAPLVGEEEEGLRIRDLIKMKAFWLMIILMICAGAAEQSVSQWASTFAEMGLGVNKTIGDLAGPMFFAITMGISRTIFGKYGDKLNLNRYMIFSTVLCLFSYLLISLSQIPALGLIGCGICGFSVGIMWPGTFSIAAKMMRGGGTALFAFLALAGDLGCTSGPTLVGVASEKMGNDLQMGILAAIIFPILLLLGLFAAQRIYRKGKA